MLKLKYYKVSYKSAFSKNYRNSIILLGESKEKVKQVLKNAYPEAYAIKVQLVGTTER